MVLQEVEEQVEIEEAQIMLAHQEEEDRSIINI